VSEAWVVNASPLTLFSRIGRLDLIDRLTPNILTPSAVIGEVRDGAAKDGTSIAGLQWAARYQVPNAEVPASVERWDLGSGESQVIAHAVLGDRWAVLDDLAARRCAMAHNVPVIGSLGVVLRAKKRGLIEQARPVVERLVEAGMFLDEALLGEALRAVGE
jgi:predicted nucleic acid-binding protein